MTDITTVQKVAEILDMEVQELNEMAWLLKSKEGFSVSVLGNVYRAKGRFVISPKWEIVDGFTASPNSFLPGEECSDCASEITVAKDRDPEGIAKSIGTRIIKGLRRLHPMVQKEILRRKRAAENRKKLASELCELASPLGSRRSDRCMERFTIFKSNGIYGDFELDPRGEKCRIELSNVSIEQTKAILAILSGEAANG